MNFKGKDWIVHVPQCLSGMASGQIVFYEELIASSLILVTVSMEVDP